MALITAAEARLAIPELTGTGEDAALNTLITRADRALAAWCGYPASSAGGSRSLEQTTYTHYSGIDFVVQSSRWFILPVRPVISITSIHDDDSGEWTYGTDELVASSDYVVDGASGRVDLVPEASHGGWGKGHRQLKVVYSAGYTTAPDDLKHAVVMLVKHWWDLRRRQGKVAASAGGVSSSGLGPHGSDTGDTIPVHVRQIVGRYRLWSASVG